MTSGLFAAIGHDPATETLAVQFLKPLHVYHFRNFSAVEYTAFAEAKSLGEHFYKHIKPYADKYPYQNMGIPAAPAPATAPMSKELFAMLLHGRQRGSEMTREEEMQAMTAGLVIVFGAVDHLMKFRGAIYDDFKCADGHPAHFDSIGLVPSPNLSSRSIEALQSSEEDGIWTYRTDVPHATFEIMDGGEVYCRGIVISVADLGGVGA